MQSQAHAVSAKTGTLNVRLVSDAALIDEVVVVAYGTRKKGTIAGAVSTVKAEKLENVPAAGFDQSLQGQTPGLSVIRVRHRCLFWMVCLFPVLTLIRSVREI